jgi:hypothetical protein
VTDPSLNGSKGNAENNRIVSADQERGLGEETEHNPLFDSNPEAAQKLYLVLPAVALGVSGAFLSLSF